MDRRSALKMSNQSLMGMDPVLTDDVPVPSQPKTPKKTSEEKTPRKEKTEKKTQQEKVPITVTIPSDLSVYLTIKANRSGKTIQKFFEDLITKYSKKLDKANPYDESLNKYRQIKNTFVRRTIYISNDSKTLMKDSSAKLGMKLVSYGYYLVDKEKENDKECADM